ncbi:site-specific integrase [Planococcus lenghuensis]|uniref:Core-binding (CB) domain-containing protein n=1 Tax=Planococcus lenghuensis TaxID=2213202 RepID=A0A1Q2L5Z8_9BACL|nr:site-specific integrase [Planococcus lenghuensis]AQQ55342.1 hypothetical protein B0X71_19400 [Planococcus lenghuensis]
MLKIYEKYRLDKGIHPNTLVLELDTLKHFLHFLNLQYGRKPEPFEIRPKDVRAYMEREMEKGLHGSTLNRKLTILRQFFHFLWETGKLPVDFMPKFQFDVPVDEREATLLYETFLAEQPGLLRNDSLPVNYRLYFLFAMRGLKMRDIEQLRTVHLNDLSDRVELRYEMESGVIFRTVFQESEEVALLLQVIERALFREHDYIISSTKKHGPAYVKMNSQDLFGKLNSVLPQKFRTEEVRNAYIFHLYKKGEHTVEEMAAILGLTPAGFTRSLQTVLELYKNIDYTVVTN